MEIVAGRLALDMGRWRVVLPLSLLVLELLWALITRLGERREKNKARLDERREKMGVRQG